MEKSKYRNVPIVVDRHWSKAPKNLGQELCGYENVQSVVVRGGQRSRYFHKAAKVSTDKILLIVDISNIYCCVSRCFDSRKVDYSKLLCKIIRENGSNIKPIAYGTEVESNSYFMAALEKLGFELKFRKPRTYEPDGKGIVRGKANLDVEIAVDITSMINDYDLVILVSADGDFAPCLDYAKKNGKRTKVIGCRVSRALKNIADEWEEIDFTILESR